MLLATLTSIAVLAIAVSLDSIGVGITYGIRKIKIPLLSVFIIASCSGAIIAISMQAGVWLSRFINESYTSRIGALILISIGIWALYQSYRGMASQHEAAQQSQSTDSPQKKEATIQAHHNENSEMNSTAQLLTIEIKRLGLVIQILRKPQTADFDASGTISSSEAMMLGIALSLDALGAGLAAGMLGLHAMYTPLIIAGCSALFLVGGTVIGRKLAQLKMLKYMSYLPGVMLIILGLIKWL